MILCINVVNFLLKGYVNANNSKFIYLYPFINPSNFLLGATWVLFYQHILCVTLMENKVLFDFYIFNIVLNKTTHKKAIEGPMVTFKSCRFRRIMMSHLIRFKLLCWSISWSWIKVNFVYFISFILFWCEFLFSTKKVKTASFQRNSCIKY